MKSTILLVLPIAAFVLLLVSGCTVVGYTLGSAMDHESEPSYVPIPSEDVFILERGQKIDVQEEGQETRRVTFLEMRHPNEEALVEVVKDGGMESTSSACMNAGDRMLIEEVGKKPVYGIFLGASTTHIWYRLPDERQVRKSPFHSLKGIRSGSFSMQEHYLTNLMEGRL